MIKRFLVMILTTLLVTINGSAAYAEPFVSKGIAAGGAELWSTTRLSDYSAMKSAGATRIRMDMAWLYVQPTSAAFDWSLVDATVADVNSVGLKYLAILHTTPSWANSGRGDYSPPNNLYQLDNYCYQAVKRYLPLGVNEYEIGNEVNLSHPGWTASGSYYVRNLLTPCSRGIKRASVELNRPVTILMGALAPPATGQADPRTFLQDTYSNGGADRFDVLSYHPYGVYPLTDENMNSVPDELDNITVRSIGQSRKIWATEYGAPTFGEYSVIEDRQAELVSEAYRAWFMHSYAGPLLWYSHRDRGTSSDREDYFGLLRYDGSQKPAYFTYSNVAAN